MTRAVARRAGRDHDADQVEGAEVDERLDHGALRGLAQAAVDVVTAADRDAGTYGAPPSLPQVTTCRPWPARRSRRRGRGRGGPSSPRIAAAVQEADLHALADPAADHGVGVDDEQHGRGGAGDPQHPADQPVVVEHGHVRADARRRMPASMVTVRENDCAGPEPDHAGRHQRVAERLGRGGEPVELLEPVAVVVGWSRLHRGARRSRPRARRRRSRSALRERTQSGTAVNGRTAVATPASTGPNTSPTARRAGSSGESSPPR